jgi:uncharacterized protein (TIRG00374 family)
VKAKIIFWINLALGAAILAFMLRTYGGPALDVLQRAPSSRLIATFLAVVAASITCLSFRWGFILRGLSPPPALAILTLQRSAAHSLAVLVPSGKVGGDPLRAFLATQTRVPAGDAIASVTVDRTLEIASSAPFSVIFAALLLQHGIPNLESALATVIIGTFGLAIGVALAVRRLRSGAGLVSALVRRASADRLQFVDSQMEIIESAETSTVRLLDQPRRILMAFGMGLVANLLVIAEFACLLAAFGLPFNTIAVVAAVFATGAAHMLPVPGGIGVLEGAHVWIFGMLGYPTEVGLAVGLAVRFRELIWMAPGLLYLLVRSLAASRKNLRVS